MSVFIMLSAGSTGIDEPPGITAFSWWPLRTRRPFRAARERRAELHLVIAGAVDVPGDGDSLVPPLFGLPSARNASPPLRTIQGTAAKVSVLLMVVGFP